MSAPIPEEWKDLYRQCENPNMRVLPKHARELIDRIAALEAESREWKTWGIIEIAVRNPNVSSYIDHWEGRTVKAEAQIQELRLALATIKIETGSSTLQWHIADAALAATEPK